MFYMPAAKGQIPLKYKEHALAVAKRWIRERLHAGYNQTQIGVMLGGLSQSTVSDMGAGKATKLGIRTLFAMREAMGVSLDELLGLPPLSARDSSSPHHVPPAPVATRRAK